VLEIIRRLGTQSTVLFSTHILTDVERICDRVAILDRGRLVTESRMDELLARYAQPVYLIEPEAADAATRDRLAEGVGRVAAVTAVEALGDVLRVEVSEAPNVPQQLLAAITATGTAIVRFERQRPTLEDVFLRLVGRDAGPSA
jgi:ABC-2 type transport system ATP-binding protein